MTETFRRVPKQERSRKRYDEILETAAKIFADKGFEAVTTNEIAAAAGMSIGSLYQYFNNKEAIVEALSDYYLESLSSITGDFLSADVVELPVEDAVERMMGPVIEFHTQNTAFSRLWLGADLSTGLKGSIRSMDDAVRDRLEKQLRRRMPGLRRDRARMIATVSQSALKSLLALLIRSDDKRFQNSATREVKRMVVEYMKAIIREHDANQEAG